MVEQTPIRSMRRYARNGVSDVQGWFEPEDVELAEMFLRFQLRRGLSGNVAEIGVHHGKCFLLLANGVRADEEAVALDVFGDQEKNVDRSGLGDREIFERHVARWAQPDKVRIVQASSLEVTPERAAEVFGKVRFFSVDGGHTGEITAHDLRLAEAVLVPNGLVMLDDILNPHWTGVITGLADYLRTGGQLIPFVVSRNKLFLTTSLEAVRMYRGHYRSQKDELIGKSNVEFFGHTVDVFGQGSRRRRQEDAARAAREAEFKTMQRRLAEAQGRINELEASTSWRVTGPLRAASEVVRRVPRPRRNSNSR